MPFCVLLEAALQPCGWLASFAGSALGTDQDLAFRNLDGTGQALGEVWPEAGPLRTIATLESVSRSGGMILQSFRVRCLLGETPVYEMQTGFGFFPAATFENQDSCGSRHLGVFWLHLQHAGNCRRSRDGRRAGVVPSIKRPAGSRGNLLRVISSLLASGSG
jgi:hypothetical protein